MSIFYIRHSIKTHKNGRVPQNTVLPYYALDPDLTSEGEVLAKEKFQILFQSYTPHKIVTSPFLRTRRTAKIAQQVIYELTNTNIDITIDHQLSEYINKSKHHIKDEDFHPDTLIHHPISEYMSQYKRRIKNHYDGVDFNDHVLYITHGMNIQQIAQLHQQPIKYPREVCGIKIINQQIELI